MHFTLSGLVKKKSLINPQKVVDVFSSRRHNIRVVGDMSRMRKTLDRIKEEAYQAGFNAGREKGVQIGIEMGLSHTIEIMSGELHRYKFPEGHEKRWNHKIDQHRPDDNSTFEFTYERYEDRIKKREAEARVQRTQRKYRASR